MSEEQTQNTNTQDNEDIVEPTEQVGSEPQKSAKKGKGDKKSAKDAQKEQSRLKKEWEDSIVASKKVKREETRRKLKRAMLILLVFSLIVTSVVYVMLLFIEENSVRITASSNNKDKSISLSIDNEYWTPYLNVGGPKYLKDLSYNAIYDREPIDKIEHVRELLNADSVETGSLHGNEFIRFSFMLKNTGTQPALVSYEMSLEFDDHKLHDAVRVMWGQSFKSDYDPEGAESRSDVKIYASLSNNPRLASTAINADRTAEDGYLEYVAYPVGSDKNDFSLARYENETIAEPADRAKAVEEGYFAATPFESDSYIFQREETLAVGDIMYCYVCIWIEGSDFDCVDSKLGGYCKLGLSFVAN